MTQLASFSLLRNPSCLSLSFTFLSRLSHYLPPLLPLFSLFFPHIHQRFRSGGAHSGRAVFHALPCRQLSCALSLSRPSPPFRSSRQGIRWPRGAPSCGARGQGKHNCILYPRRLFYKAVSLFRIKPTSIQTADKNANAYRHINAHV